MLGQSGRPAAHGADSLVPDSVDQSDVDRVTDLRSC